MADDAESDDQWLYGDGTDAPNLEPPEDESSTPPKSRSAEKEKRDQEADESLDDKQPDSPNDEAMTPPRRLSPVLHPPGTGSNGQLDDLAPPGTEDDLNNDDEKQNGDGSDKDDSEEDSDDDVNVVIGDIKTSPAYTSLNIKRGGLLTSTVVDKSKQSAPQTGKFSVEEFDQTGMINGVNAAEYNMDGLEDKPWRKPGADITDYFNYGFNEDTWKAYCERQKRMRVNESGVGLVPLNAIGLPRGPIQIMNDNSKYSSSGGQYYGGGGGGYVGGFGSGGPMRKAGPPPARSMTGAIDVIGGPAPPGTKMMMDAPKENIIQVMTADRREYSRKPPGYPDMSMPPPNFEEFQPEFGFNPEPEPFYGGYEPTQDVQWAGSSGNQTWAPSEIKPLTPGPGMVPAPVPPVMAPPMAVPPVPHEGRPKDNGSPPPPRRDSRDREVSRSRSEKPRDRDRERSHRRERSRSRSRRHRSRSRSPSHRHKKKKSRRHEDSD